MSNLLKYNNVVEKGNTRIIDSNGLVDEKLERIRHGDVAGRGFVEGLNIKEMEVAEEEPTEEELREEADQILENANAKAEEIIATAKLEAEGIKRQVVADAHKEGFASGYSESIAEIDKMKRELEQKEKQLMEEYEEKVKKIEPELVEVLLDVFSRVTHTMAEDKRDMILALVDSVMSQVELSRNFLIRVSKDDYRFLVDNKEKIYGAASNNAHIDIYEDVTLTRNECIIETDMGIFDCSLDIQLENLIKDIKLLSCI